MGKADLGDIFRDGFEDFHKQYGPLPKEGYQAAYAIKNCKSTALGGHKYKCDHCGNLKISYNSCRNRHCPACQGFARAQWVDDRLGELLPVQYFHLVFTIPQQLNPFALRNKKVFYSIMFRAMSETLLEIGADPKRLGAMIGFIAILHTWGQNLMDHPHIHCVVPAGGIKNDKSKWVYGTTPDYLFPVKVLAQLFRGKFLDYFKKACTDGSIGFQGELQSFEQNPRSFSDLLDTLYATNWVVYAKAPFAGPEAVLKYLGRYTHRIAISNNRIISCADSKVSFAYKDYADNSKTKTMTLSEDEFIRRFMMHVVPSGFVRIRYYGFLACRAKSKKLDQCRLLLGQRLVRQTKKKWFEVIEALTGKDPRLCEKCGYGKYYQYRKIRPKPKMVLIGSEAA